MRYRRQPTLIGLLCLLNACATPAPPPALPVLPASVWHSSAPPRVEAALLQGAAAEALLRAAPRPKVGAEDVGQAAMFMAYSCAYALCLGGPILIGIGQAHLAMVLPPLAAKLEAIKRDPDGPLSQGLAQRLGSSEATGGSASLRIESALLLDGVGPDSVCLNLRSRIELQDQGQVLYREFISFGGPLTTAGAPRTDCRSVDQWLANDGAALAFAVQNYADALPGLIRGALPGWTAAPP